MDFICFFLYGILMELIWILYGFFEWNFDGIDMDFNFFLYGIYGIDMDFKCLFLHGIWIIYVFFFLYGIYGIDMDFICFFVWNFDGIDIDFIWFFWGGILMELIWMLYVFFVWNLWN